MSEDELPTAAKTKPLDCRMCGSTVFEEDGGLEKPVFACAECGTEHEGIELVRLEDIPDWLTQKEQEILNREHGKMSYRDEGVVKAVFHILRKELVGEDPELFHEVKASVEKKNAEGDASE